MPPGRGLFVTLEGIDGAGKSTQARALADWLRGQGHRVVATREPGGAPGAEAIRALLVNGEPGRWSAETECLLFTAARRDHLERTVLPALARGETVITDRFADSTRVYQGLTRGDLRGLVDRLHDLVIARDPDLTFLIDMDPQEALTRTQSPDRQAAEDRFEAFGVDFQTRVRAGFLDIARAEPQRVRLIDGSGPPEAVAARVWAAFAAAERAPVP